MTKLQSFFKALFDILDDVLAYLLTVIGIVLSAYIPMLNSGAKINFNIDWWRIGLSAVVAFLLVAKQESLDVDENGSKDRSRAGRRKRFWTRMANALSQGFMWNQLMQIGK